MSYELFFADSSDDEEEVTSELEAFTQACEQAYEASRPKKRSYIYRDYQGAHNRLVDAYFTEGPQYEAETFRDRFRMDRDLFLKIVDDLKNNYAYFRNSTDALNRECLSPLLKCTSAIRQLAYGAVPDSLDEYLQMGATTARECLRRFCTGIMQLYGTEYLRKPTYTDMEKLYAFHEEKHGFPGMLGSIDCTHWPWENCPVAYKAQFSRRDQGSTPFILLEAVASQDLWIWHAFFGVAGMNNDVNVLRQSPIFNDLKSGKAPELGFVANNVHYRRGYYLTDGIYPQWSVLIKSIQDPPTNDHKRRLYKTKHEAARKDVERAFGVLKAKWKMIDIPARGLSKSRLSDIMYTCIILHNMVIKHRGAAISPNYHQVEEHADNDPINTHEERLQITQQIVDPHLHLNLKADLVEHIWNNRNG